MLEVILLKTSHAGINEAKKLERYIEWCDIYSPESAGGTEKEARSQESAWEKLLKGSKSTALKALKANEDNYPETNYYNFWRHNLLHKKGKKIIHLEILSDEERSEVLEYRNKILESKDLDFLTIGKVDMYLQSHRILLSQRLKFTELRDKNIARNIDEAEEKIRKRFTELTEKPIIKLAVEIGGMHNPEKYITKCAPQVIDLTHDKSGTLEKSRTFYAIRDVREIADIELLRFGLLELSEEKNLGLNPKEINTMDYDALVKLATQ